MLPAAYTLRPPDDPTTGHRRLSPPAPHPAESLKCPRCHSTNTKFCYYNNYSLSQPRHFCKSCRRYWTKGGTLRNIPVGGGCRRNKRLKPGAPGAGAALHPLPATIPRGVCPPSLPPPFAAAASGGSLYGELAAGEACRLGGLPLLPPPGDTPSIDTTNLMGMPDHLSLLQNGAHARMLQPPYAFPADPFHSSPCMDAQLTTEDVRLSEEERWRRGDGQDELPYIDLGHGDPNPWRSGCWPYFHTLLSSVGGGAPF